MVRQAMSSSATPPTRAFSMLLWVTIARLLTLCGSEVLLFEEATLCGSEVLLLEEATVSSM